MVTTEDILRVMEAADLPAAMSAIEVNTPLIKQGLDSLDMAELMLAVEKKYNKAIPVEQAARLRTLNDIVNFLNA
ncbi:MAG TPA: phosphopantetheine-binding protein [Polyangiaceae bacterium]|jgi:acyl carrier protein|nr:phosphopantetheine-binding protein [Polyangiaceae bacterium]